MRRWRTAAVIIVLGLLAVGVIALVRRPASNPAGAVKAVAVKQGTLEASILAPGQVSPVPGAQIDIGSRVSGIVRRVLVKVGDQVRPGQVIAEIDPAEQQIAVTQAQATLAAAQGALAEAQAAHDAAAAQAEVQVDQARAALTTAEAREAEAGRTLSAGVQAAAAALRQAEATLTGAGAASARQQRLYAQDFVAKQDAQNAQVQMQVAAAQVDAARQRLAQAGAQQQQELRVAHLATQQARTTLSAAQVQAVTQQALDASRVAQQEARLGEARAALQKTDAVLSYYTIRAPIAGTVVALQALAGETVAASLSTPTFATLVDLSRLQLTAQVSEADIGKVQLGQPVRFTVLGYPNDVFRATVDAISGAGTITTGVVTYTVVAAIAPADAARGLLRPAMTASARIIYAVRKHALYVPFLAVRTDSQGPYVLAVQGNTVVKRRVKTGLETQDSTEITQGLRAGERVVLSGG
ncbi:MAG: hypothetical protein NVS3B18_04420 [Candidatus Dormibacteria bacterium]